MRRTLLVKSIRSALVLAAATATGSAGAVRFEPPVLVDGSAAGISGLATGDFDGDTDIDIAATLAGSDELVWYENSGSQTFGRRSIDPAAGLAAAVLVTDLDRDGDLDLVSSAPGAGRISWHRNDGSGGFSVTPIDSAAPAPRAITVADLDRDGDQDLVATLTGSDTLAWYENDGNQVFTRHDIAGDVIDGAAVQVIDLDRDGDRDIVLASAGDDTLAWYENDGSEGFSRALIDDAVLGASAVAAADLDRDGDIDVAVTAELGDRVSWYENDGTNGFSERTISDAVIGPAGLALADIDRDASPDLLVAGAGSGTLWLFANDGTGDFTAEQLDGGAAGIGALSVVDIDGDGDPDVVSGAADLGRLAYQESNSTSRSAAFAEPRIPNGTATYLSSVAAADVDGDGATDLLSTSVGDNKVVWYENDRAGSYDLRTIQTGAVAAKALAVADLNQDGLADVITVSSGNSLVAWNEQQPDGSFVTRQISTFPFLPQAVDVVDVDGDGSLDVLTASYQDDLIAWFRNDGSENFSRLTISNDADGAVDVKGRDLDGDGDVDIVSASFLDEVMVDEDTTVVRGKIAWYENDGNDNFTPHTISTLSKSPRAVDVADVDGDGDLDVLSAAFVSNAIFWHENDGAGDFTTLRTASEDVRSPRDVQAVDLDGDGDMDVLAASYLDAAVLWLENDGSGSFDTFTIATGLARADGVFGADIDDDGDPDVLVAPRFLEGMRYIENCGGQYRLSALDLTPESILGGETVPLLELLLESNAKVGEPGTALVAVPLRLLAEDGEPLDATAAAGLLDGLRLIRDTGNGFLGDNDELVGTLDLDGLAPDGLPDGRILLPLTPPDPTRVVADSFFDRTFFLVGEIDFEAEQSPAGALRVRYDANSPLGPVARAEGSAAVHVPECTDPIDTRLIEPTGTLVRPTVDLSIDSSTASEAGATLLRVTASLSAPTDTDESVTLALGGTGVGPEDFSFSTLMISLPDNTLTGSATFRVQDDLFQEGEETAFFSIASVSRGLLPGATSTVSATIADDDTASLAVGDLTIDETSILANVPVTLTNGIQGGFTVDFATADGSAREGSDYIAASGQLAFTGAVGESLMIEIPLLDDAVFEGDESFTIALSAPTAPVALTDPIGEVTILDDETAALSIADVVVDEAAGSALLTVTLDGATQSPFSVAYATADGSASSGTDFTATMGELAFAGTAGENQSFSVPIIDDGTLEGDEVFSVTLSGADLAIGLPDPVAEVTITDDDVALLAIDNPSAGEADGELLFTVSLTGATQDPFTVEFATGDLTATAGEDYVQRVSQLAFSGVQDEVRTIAITLLEDTLVEGSESFTLSLSDPTGGVTLVDAVGQGTISDNDVASELIFANGFEAEDPEPEG